MKSVAACLKALWAMSKPVRWRVVLTIVAGMLRIAASLGFIWISKCLVDIATGRNDMPLKSAIALFVGILTFQICMSLFCSWWENYSRIKAQNVIRQHYFGHVLGSRWDGMERFLSGDTVNRLEEDSRVVSVLVTESVPGMLLSFLQLLAGSAYMLTLAPGLLWVLVILMCVAVFGSGLFFFQVRKLMRYIRKRESELQQHMQENLQHRLLVRTLNCAEKVMERFGWLQTDIEKTYKKRLNYNAVARGLVLFGFQAGHVTAFLWGIFGIIDGTVTFGTMTAFLQLVGQVQRPIASMGAQIPGIINAVTSIERLAELEDLEQEDTGEMVQLAGAPGIAVSDVTYSYPDAKEPVMSGFSYDFPAGSMTVVTGITGVGKSTLIYMILGLIKPQEGSVKISGIDAGAALRGNFMYVPQGNTLLSGTIRTNLAMADPDAGEDAMWQALETACAGFVRRLPDGLDTVSGEIGSGLSEGQAQRIAIARSLLRPGGVLILDECTSALDSQTEQKLLQNLHDVYKGRKTIICISHRQAALSFADQVLNIEKQNNE